MSKVKLSKGFASLRMFIRLFVYLFNRIWTPAGADFALLRMKNEK